MTQAPNADAALIKTFSAIDGDLRGKVQMIDTGTCPLRLLPGECDFSCPPEDTKRTTVSIPGARLIVMAELGHFPMSENSRQFRRTIAPVLNEIVKLKVSPKQGVHA